MQLCETSCTTYKHHQTSTIYRFESLHVFTEFCVLLPHSLLSLFTLGWSMVSGWHPIHDNFPWNGRATSRCCSCRSAYRSNASRLPSATGEISFRVRVDCTNIYKYLQAAKSLPISFKNKVASEGL